MRSTYSRVLVGFGSVVATLLIITLAFGSPVFDAFVYIPLVENRLEDIVVPTKQALTPTAAATTKPVPTATPIAAPEPSAVPTPKPVHNIKNVFVIVMENRNWSSILNNPSAPYINETLLPIASHAERYYNPPNLHPSLRNYLWMEAGTDFGIENDREPSANSQTTKRHLVTLLENAGVSWKSYQEDIDGTTCPLKSEGLYAARHNPMVYFDDVTDNGSPHSARCIAHVRPFEELAVDLQQGTVAGYNFITPNLCNDMHDSNRCETTDGIKNGDTWLAEHVPTILNSNAYQQGGALFITWDEGFYSDGPIGMIVLSPFAKGQGYSNTIPYTHSSLLRTIQEIFGVTPLLRDAANAQNLGDLFRQFP